MMSGHVERVKRAIEFRSPDRIPLDLVDVPHLYDAYGTLDPDTVTVPSGAEDFDSGWCTYHWALRPLGTNERGETLRTDEWGCTQVVPEDQGTAYSVIARPDLNTLEQAQGYPWPRPENTDEIFETKKGLIQRYYADRFINGFLDPGPFLVAFELLGYEGLMIKLMENLPLVKAVLRSIVDYQKALIPRFKYIGAHMVTIIDEIAGTAGLMFSPKLFRHEFLDLYRELLDEIHRHGLYTSILLDGNIAAILPDLMKLDIDVQLFVQPHATGLEVIEKYFAGKRAVKLSVDMMETLVRGSPQEIQTEVADFVRRFDTPKGGLLFQALRWHRPAYDSERVAAAIAAMNRYRRVS
jgi:hypothetical protein